MKHQEDSKYKIVELLKKGIDVGFISEAGCPNIADSWFKLL
jgi:16S rRNA C1402 (ribose-2'-O) methylase RsmI